MRYAFRNIQEFRAKFETDKILRAEWKQETGEEIGIDIQETDGKNVLQQASDFRAQQKLSSLLEGANAIQEEENDDEEEAWRHERKTGDWTNNPPKTERPSENKEKGGNEHDDDWKPTAGNPENEPRFGGNQE